MINLGNILGITEVPDKIEWKDYWWSYGNLGSC